VDDTIDQAPIGERAPIGAASDETVVATGRVVGCDGGGGALGHPLVYLKIGAEGEVVCPYCSRRFVLAADAGGAARH
jgi:uncharacterized Zn-finger protein